MFILPVIEAVSNLSLTPGQQVGGGLAGGGSEDLAGRSGQGGSVHSSRAGSVLHACHPPERAVCAYHPLWHRSCTCQAALSGAELRVHATLPTLNAACACHAACHAAQGEVVDMMLRRFQAAEAEDLPAVVRFLLHHATIATAKTVVCTLRDSLHFAALSDPRLAVSLWIVVSVPVSFRGTFCLGGELREHACQAGRPELCVFASEWLCSLLLHLLLQGCCCTRMVQH